MGSPSYMWSVVDRNVVMQLMTVHPSLASLQRRLEHERFHSTSSRTKLKRWLHHKPSLMDALLITRTTLTAQRVLHDFVV